MALKIDAHQHFWQFDPIRDSWITDDMAVIQKNFLPEGSLEVLKANGFDGCVAVQASQSESETEFLLALAESNDFIKGVVGWVDLRSNDIYERLEYFSQFENVKGFRHVVQGEKDPEFMLKPDFRRGITELGAYDFTYDILIYYHQLAQSVQFAKLFPDQKFVLDHIGKPDIKGTEINEWRKEIRKLALYENVNCKLSGIITEADWQNWKEEDLRGYLDVVFEAFGTDRLMFGSDYPVCLVAGSYEKMLAVIDNYISKLSASEKAKILGENAVRFYNL